MNGKGPRAINRGWAVTLLGLAMGISSSAAAQGRQIDLNQFRPAELATDGFATSTPDGQGHARFGFQVWLDYSDDALEIAGQKVVHQQMTGHLMLSLGLADHLVLFVDMPYHFIIEESSGVTTGVTVKHQNVGDLYFGARFNFYGTREDVFQIGAQAAMTINTASLASSQQTFAGQVDKKPYLGGWFELLLNFNAGDVVRIPLQIGYKLGTQGQLLGVPPDVVFVGNEFTYGGGVLIMLGDDQFMISAEAFGRTAANSTVSFWSKNETPVEVLGGFKWLPDFGFTLGVGGSAGVTDGYGAPDWRAFGMLGYTMPADKKEPDADGDGIPDELDKCPTEAEDFDGFQDEDGCPDLDNDGDGVLDVDDKCPNDPEDMDGFEDEDGCPDPDNDGDGILDVDDQCPNDAGPPENHGCPDPDRDGDGVPHREPWLSGEAAGRNRRRPTRYSREGLLQEGQRQAPETFLGATRQRRGGVGRPPGDREDPGRRSQRQDRQPQVQHGAVEEARQHGCPLPRRQGSRQQVETGRQGLRSEEAPHTKRQIEGRAGDEPPCGIPHRLEGRPEGLGILGTTIAGSVHQRGARFV